jgi:hypothetical protein
MEVRLVANLLLVVLGLIQRSVILAQHMLMLVEAAVLDVPVQLDQDFLAALQE